LEIELLLHNYGLRETHKIVDEIEKEIKEEIPNVDSVFIPKDLEILENLIKRRKQND